MGQTFGRERKEFFVHPFRCKRIASHDLGCDTRVDRVDHRFHGAVTGGKTKPADSFIGLKADQQLVGPRHDKVTDPVWSAVFWCLQYGCFDFAYTHIIYCSILFSVNVTGWPV